MKKHLVHRLAFALAVVAASVLVGCHKDEKAADSGAAASRPEAPSSPASAAADPSSAISSTPPFAGGPKTSFQDVTSQLDPGGSLFLYVSTDQMLSGLSTKIGEFKELVAAIPGPDGEGIGRVIDVLSRLAKASGIEEINGFGMSAAPVAPGLFRNKLIAQRTNTKGQGLLWSMFGQAPHALNGSSMLPTNTALAMFGDLDVKQLWAVVEKELAQSGILATEEIARNWPQMFEKETQIPWAGLLECLAGEVGLVLTLDTVESIEVPIGGGGGGAQIVLPAPGLIAVVKVNNWLLFDRLSRQLQANPKAVTTEAGGLKMCSMEVPAPFPLELTVASGGDYLYVASSSQLVRTIQAVRQGSQPGLKSSAGYKALAQHLPSEGNQFLYVDKRFGETFIDIQQQVIGRSGMPAGQLDMIQRLMGAAGASSSLAIGANTANGWQLTSTGSKDSGSAVLLAPAVGVTAVAAGLMLPALAKAKSKAQTISTVSNLKQLGLAARMYANDNEEKFPKAETWSDDLKSFAGSTKIYKAPNDSSPSPCSFAYNAKLSGRSESQINPQTVLFFEVENGRWNLSGGPELLLTRPRGGAFVVGFADGSVQMLQPAQIRSLRWDP